MATVLYDFLETGPRTRRQRCELLHGQLWSDRQGGGWDSHWRELSDYYFPRRSRFYVSDRNRGDKRNQNIIDSTGRYAARTLASGLHAGLTSPARPWMKLSTPDTSLNAYPPVKLWLQEVTDRMLTVFALTNLYNALPTVYGDLGVFGTAAMACFSDPEDLFRAYTFPLGSYALGLDQRGLVTTFVREYELTVRQVVEQFGVRTGYRDIDWSVMSPDVKRQWDQGNYEVSVPIVHIVFPNEGADPRKLAAKYLPWASFHYERDYATNPNLFLRESGFKVFPIMAPRWETTDNDAYGTDSPGMTALGDTKQLQTMQRRSGQLLQKAVDPPLKGPSALRTQKTSLLAGDITYVDVRDGQQGLAPIHEVRLEGYQHLELKIDRVQYSVKRAFFEDLFMMLAQSDPARGMQPITAREVEERHEEKLLALGPVLERTNDELLDPLVDRVFQLMEDAGLIPDPPDELDGVQLKVEYISVLAQAQKLIGVVGQDRFLQSTAPFLENPDVAAKIDFMQVVDNYGDMLGVDPRVIRPTDEAKQIVARQAQAMQAQADAEQAKNLATAAHQASAAPVAVDSPLDRMLRNAGAPA
jgi:hypothetical protein